MEHKLVSCWFLCLCSCIFSLFKTISLHGVRHVRLLFVSDYILLIQSLLVLPCLCKLCLIVYPYLLGFQNIGGAVILTIMHSVFKQQISWCIWLGGACLCFANRLCGCCHQTPKRGRLKEQARLLLRFGVNDTTHTELIVYFSMNRF